MASGTIEPDATSVIGSSLSRQGDALLILGGAAGGGAGGTGRIEAAIANAGSITLAGSFATGQFGTQGDGQGGNPTRLTG